jgi:mRNA-degrading endonuclease RelE of RelBE toxin-antitoxin system
MTRRPTPQLFDVEIAPSARQEFELLAPRAALAVHSFLRTVMRRQPEKYGVRLRGGLRGLFLARRADFQLTYSVDHAAHKVAILRIEPR